MDICSSKLCSGCSLCEGVCPINAIAMKSDCEGFLRPVINEEKCTECGLCAKKCPVNNKSTSLARDVFAVQSKDDNIRTH